ncbi:MAG: AAA family ATPase [Pseudanabaena sp.]|jgi:predicted ATPase
MQKIIIKNFGAIEYAEIEIKKVLVLIGEQASGKSTIAKLIYFFKSLRDDVFNQIYQDQKRDYFDENLDVISVLQEKFYNWFGSTKNFNDDFEIKFYYNFELDKSLILSLSQDKAIRCEFSPNFFNDKFKDLIGEIKKLLQSTSNTDNWLSHNQYKLAYAQIISDELNKLFNNCYQVDSLFVIAGRSATVSYSELFERELFASIKSRLQRNNDLIYHLKTQAVDEILMLEFISKILNNKVYLKDWENSYSEYHNSNYILIKKKVFEILKGEYIDDNGEEKIILNSQESICLRNASSGQQEVIRILQDILVVITKGLILLRIVEEPEAHLFPVAQKNLVELLALMVNQNDENQLIITTHSPYILTVFNNLLFAQRVVDKNPSTEAEVEELIPKEFWLKAKDFSAYSLGNSSIEEEPKYCESIFNQQTGAIKQNYLDAVSEMLGGDFNALYSIYTKNSRRR